MLNRELPLAGMLFPAAFEVWIGQRAGVGETNVRYLRTKSERTYREYAWALGRFFGDTPLNKIDDGKLRVYQERRAANAWGLWYKPCGQNRISRETCMLKRLMTDAGLWTKELDRAFKPLPRIELDTKRVPEPEQRKKLLDTMLLRDEWIWIYYWSILSLRTTASTNEMRLARLADIDLRLGTFHVAPYASKATGRNRTIPLVNEALEAAAWLVCRAKRLGANEPEHYLFPCRIGMTRDVVPTEPMKADAMKNAVNRIKKKAGLPRFKPQDMRHWAITDLAEKGVPMAQIMSYAGHLRPKMQRHYTAISDAAMLRIARVAAAPAEKKPPARVELWEVEPAARVQ